MFIFWDQYHPDMNKNPGAEEKFKEISAAYEVISYKFHRYKTMIYSVLLFHLLMV